jgi:hypothetical protein
MEAVESLAQRTPTEMTMNAAANRKFFKQTAHIMAEIIDFLLQILFTMLSIKFGSLTQKRSDPEG